MTDVDLIPAPEGTVLAELEQPGIRVIEPARSRVRIRDLRDQVPVIRVLAARDFKMKYKQSLLGPIWLLIQPLALLGAFAVAFSSSTGDMDGAPYVLFALSGLCVWAWFQAAVTMGGASLVSNNMLIRRTACPRSAFPVASLLATLPTLALTAGSTILLALALGELSQRALLLPLAAIWLFVLTTAVSWLAAAAAVFFRDVLNAMPFLLQVGVFLAPIGYAIDNVSTPMQVVLRLNPLTGVIEAWRWLLLPEAGLDLLTVGVALAITVALALAAGRIFARSEVVMADVI